MLRLMPHDPDFNPLILAIAAAVPLLASSAATLLLAIAHRQQLQQISAKQDKQIGDQDNGKASKV